jgi:hypothetical protein
MAQMNGAFKFAIDTEAQTTLRAEADGAETPGTSATVNETAVALNALSAAYWQTDGEVAEKQIAVVFYVSAITTASSETYALNVQFDDAADMASAVQHSTFAPTAVGFYVFYFDLDTVKALDATGKPTHIRTQLVTGGSGTPSIDYWAFMVPLPNIG